MMYQQQVQGQMRPNPNPYPPVLQGQGQGMKAMGQGQGQGPSSSRQVQSYQTQGHQQTLYPTDFGHGHSALNGTRAPHSDVIPPESFSILVHGLSTHALCSVL
jgi:hypothetical protein